MRARRCSRSRSVLVGEELVVEVLVGDGLGVVVLGVHSSGSMEILSTGKSEAAPLHLHTGVVEVSDMATGF